MLHIVINSSTAKGKIKYK